MTTVRLRMVLLTLLAPALLTACGGGSGGGGPAATPRFGVHVVTTASLTAPESSAIDHPLLNGNVDAILLITQNWNPTGLPGVAGVYNDHPVGVGYDIPSGRWQVINRDAGRAAARQRVQLPRRHR